jgi:hypothetical protein
MLAPTHLRPSDLLGLSRLAVGGVTGMTELVEAMHAGIARVPSRSPRHTTRGLTGLVYRSVRGVTALVGGSLDAVLGPLVPLFAERPSSASREAVVAALNGVLGDHLEATGNPLAIPMCLRLHGRPLALAAEPLATAIPAPTGKLLVLAHGLCMNDLQWQPTKPDHSDLALGLARDLGYTPLFLHYNSGRHVSTNGRELSALLATLVGCWPVPVSELAIIGHSMGGLVARSACHYAAGDGAAWLARLRDLVFLATPHHGAPLERGGNWVDVILGAAPYAAPLARLGKVRSAGITDLRHGNLLDDDWAGHDRFARRGDRRRPVPLPAGVRCFAMAATKGRARGDGLVPLASALGRHADPDRHLAIPEGRQWVGRGRGHWDLLRDAAAHAQISDWLR